MQTFTFPIGKSTSDTTEYKTFVSQRKLSNVPVKTLLHLRF